MFAKGSLKGEKRKICLQNVMFDLPSLDMQQQKKEYSNSQFFYFVLFYSHMLPDRLSKGEEVRLHIFNTYAKNMFVLNGEQLM